jgi:hypothetical protein
MAVSYTNWASQNWIKSILPRPWVPNALRMKSRAHAPKAGAGVFPFFNRKDTW